MYFVLQSPSLQRAAEVQVVAALWNQRNIITQIEQLSLTIFDEGLYQAWDAIEENVKSNVSALPLPVLCKEALLMVVKALGIEIYFRWRPYHTVESTIFHTRRFCWTMHGTLDYSKTAELMLKDRSLDLEKRYELACINCFEEEAKESFELMGEERRREYSSRQREMMCKEHLELLTFFTLTLNGHARHMERFFPSTRSRGISVQKVLFENALFNGDPGICEFWYEKLSQREKTQVLEDRGQHRMSCAQSRASSLLFYLSRMNEEQQERLFRECTFGLLKCLLRWPMQSLFVEAVKCGWRFVNEGVCSGLLGEITRLVCSGFVDYDYRPLFWELWRLSPVDYRRHYVNDIYRLECLFETKDAEFIKLALNRAPSLQLKELVDNRFDKIGGVLMDKRSISEAALIECKYEAQSVSSNDKEDEEKVLRSQQLSRLVDLVIESRIQEKLT